MEPLTPNQVPAPEPKKGCIGRNWKWMLPVGCLVVVLGCGGLSLVLGGFAMIPVMVFGILKSSDLAKEAMRRAGENSEVISLLGEPLAEGSLVTGSINNGSGDIQIPITGPKGSGTIHAVGSSIDGKVSFTELSVSVKDHDGTIDLLKP